ncbi:MAG: DUF4307 domain-containing protein [Kineosporiaceae bacterium]
MSLDERYGRRPPRPGRRRWLFAALGAFVVVAGAWAVWAATSLAAASLSWRDVGVDASDPAAVRVTFEVSTAPGSRAVCVVRATDHAGTVVGWMDVEVLVPPSGRWHAAVVVPTSQPATGAGVGDCARH